MSRRVMLFNQGTSATIALMALIKTVQHQKLRHQSSFCLNGAISILAYGVARTKQASPTHADLECIRQYCGRIKSLRRPSGEGVLLNDEVLLTVAHEWETKFPSTTPSDPMRALMTPAFEQLLQTVGQALYQAKQKRRQRETLPHVTTLSLQGTFRF